ncbi:hypothetical protein [Lysobacter sp. CA199]|uniref:hypothetical protein n=1 Tax=Lysobacter sp. CA199 TaxID=3455608 RepID=UPI003F8D35DE
MKDNKFLFGFVAFVIGCFSLTGLYVAVKGKGLGADSAAAVAPASSVELTRQFEDGQDIAFLDGEAAGITMATVAGGECALDYFGQGGATSATQLTPRVPLKISGWAATRGGATAKRVWIEWKPTSGGSSRGGFIQLNAGLAREDVVSAKGASSYLRSGYDRFGVVVGVPAGSYQLYLVLDTGTELLQCDINREVTVN